MLYRLTKEWKAERIACIMDAPGKTFRHEMYAEYKANRPPIDPDLREQIEPAKEFITAFGWPLICQSGVEADDVIATLTEQAKKEGMKVVIASGDKDLTQLVGDDVTMFDGMRDKLYDRAAVQKKFGVAPEHMRDYLALVGDTSDNIPGVKNVGPKTAVKWLDEFGSLDGVIAAAPKVEKKIGERLREAIDNGMLEMSRKLVQLKTDVELPMSAAECKPQEMNQKAWQQLCEKYEFRQLAKVTNTAPTSARATAKTVCDLAQLQKMVAEARRKKIVALDTETDGEPVMCAQLVGFSLAYQDDFAAYVPLAHGGENNQDAQQIAMPDALAALRPLLEDESVVKVFHNGKYDLHIFANCGLSVCGAVEDTKIAALLQKPERRTSLSELAMEVLRADTTKYKDLVDGKKIKHFSQVDIESAAAYAAEDAEITRKLHAPVVSALRGNARKLYEEMDRPLMPVLQQMERAGILIDADGLTEFARDMRERMAALEAEAYDIAGEEFNLNSPRKLETLLFDKMGAKPLHKTESGKARSTDERTLEALADDYPLARATLRHRELAKLCNTYAEKLPHMIHPDTGRVHTDFNQTSVVTGRLSSRDPNLQNIPVRSEDGRRIRSAFIAAEGCKLISADYSQIELRLMAHISQDESLLAAFAAGADIHRRTAAEIFQVKEEQVDVSQRRAAKAVNFGLIYGMSAFGLARALKVPQQMAKGYMDRYFDRYPGVKIYMEKTRDAARKNGYVETVMGRRIPTPSGNVQAAMRAAINAPMQGSAADIIKVAMLKTNDFLQRENLKTKMLLQVHDELVLEAPDQEVSIIEKALPPLMCAAAELKVPLEISLTPALNWNDAH